MSKGVRHGLVGLAACLGLCLGWGWFAAPAWLGSKVAQALTDRAARRGMQLTVGTVWLAPGSQLTIDQLQVRIQGSADQTPLLTARRLQVDFDWQGLLSPRLWLRTVTVDSPVVVVSRAANGQLSVQELLDRLQRRDDDDDGEGGGGGLRKYLSKHLPDVVIRGATARFVDATPGPHPKVAGIDLGQLQVTEATVHIRNRSAVQEVARLEWQAAGRLAGLPHPLRLTGKLEWPKKSGEVTLELPPQLALDLKGWRAQVGSITANSDGLVAARQVQLARLDGAAAFGLDIAEIAVTLQKEAGPEIVLAPALAEKLPAMAQRLLRHVTEVSVHEPVVVTHRRAVVAEGEPAEAEDDDQAPEPDKPLDSKGKLADKASAKTATKAKAKTAKEPQYEDGRVVRDALAGVFGQGADKLANQLAKVRLVLAALPVPRVTIHQGRARFADQGDGAARELSNVSAKLERKAGEDLVTAQVDFAVPGAKASNRVEGRLDTKTGDAEWKISLENLPLQAYAAILPSALQTTAQTAIRDAAITVLYAAGPGNLTLEGKATLEHISLFAKRISRKTLEDFTVSAQGKAEVALTDQRVALTAGDLQVGQVHFLVDGQVERFRTAPKFQFQLRIPTVPCQEVVASVPRGFADMLEGMTCTGQLSYEIKGSLDTANMGSLRFDFGADLQTVQITDIGKYIKLGVFSGPFEHHARQKDGSLHTFVTGPGTGLWVPLSEISSNFTRVLFTTEDGGFWGHKGFMIEAIKEAMIANLKRGRFARGASTITQQLVKNLFFVEREKTISRKFQEAVVTWYIERKLSKQQLLELYLNIIELGPKIYGIRDASSHYFARSPSQLTLLQSLWLASIIPNPRAFYHHFRKGAVSDEWRTYLTWIAGKMFERGAITAEEFARLAATGFAVHFGAGSDGSEPVDVPSLGYEVPQGEGEPASPGTAPSVDPDQQP